MAEKLYLPEWKPPMISDEWKAEQLDQWQRGNLTVDGIKRDINFYTKE